MKGVGKVHPLPNDHRRLFNIFGEQLTIKARVNRMALGQHSLLFISAR